MRNQRQPAVAGRDSSSPLATWLRIGPVRVGVLAAAITLAFVGLRWMIAADGDISQFVVAGVTFTDRDALDPPIHVFDTHGYDGQFYYRLAIDPIDTSLQSDVGIRMDSELRFTRITYPALAYAASLGNAGRVAWTLVLVNVAAMGVAGGAAAAFARGRGRAPIVGLLVVASSGLVMSVSRDLNEPTMVAGLVGGVALLDRRAHGWAAAAWTVAVLAHEQALVMVGAYALARIVDIARRRARIGAEDLPWIVPAVGFTAWQLVRAASTGGLPILSSGEASIGLPLWGLVPELAGWLTGHLARQEVLILPELALLVATVVVATLSVRGLPPEYRWLAWGLVISVTIAVCLSHNVWVGPAELRQVVLVPTIAWLVIITARREPPRWLVGATVVVLVAVAGLRVVAI